MTFEEILQQTIEILQNRGKVSYRALKRQFNLDDAYLEDLTYELIDINEVAADQDGKMLVLTEESKLRPPPVTTPVVIESSATPSFDPHSYTPPHLVEKILTSHASLHGERSVGVTEIPKGSACRNPRA